MDTMQGLQNHLEDRPNQLQQMKKQGVPIVGHIPGGYMPEELVYAAGAIPVGLIRGGNPEAVSESVAYLPRWIDTFCRSQIGQYMLGNDPFYHLIDLLVVPVTDNNIRAIADAWNFYTDTETFRFGIPHDKDEDAYKYYLEGLYLLKDKMEQVTGTKITNDKLRDSIITSNRLWELLNAVSLLRSSSQPPISGKDFVRLNHASFHADKLVMIQHLESLYQELNGSRGPISKARMLIVGSTLAMDDYKLLDLTEQAGGAIVMEEFAEGVRHYWEQINPDGDLMEALADRYFRRRIPPAWCRPAGERVDFVRKIIVDRAIDGIIWYQLMYRDSYDIHSFFFTKTTERDTGVRVLKIQSDYDPSEIGLLRTRIETFIETLANSKRYE
ncbi:2-hydroxyacyl-CoA dehydratase subunit D [Chloroflexota bacterium]